MSLKKFLKRLSGVVALKKSHRSGQSFFEYVILLTAVAALTILASSYLYTRTKGDTEEFVNAAAAAMAPNPG